MEQEKAYIRIFLADLDKYNEGIVKGDWIELDSKFDLSVELKRLDIESEYLVADYESNLKNIKVAEYCSATELRQFGEIVTFINDAFLELEVADVIIYQAGLDYAWNVFKFEKYRVLDLSGYPDTISNNDEKLGYYLTDESGMLNDLPDEISIYFDYEYYGRDYRIAGNGDFTESGNFYVELM